MAGEQSEAFPDELRTWVERTADERDTDPGTILARAVATYRYLDGETDDGQADEFGDRMDALDDRVGAIEDDLDAKVRDVRERVVQVKREADAKAPADHDHSALDERIETTERAVDDLAGRLDRGFANYEEILEYLTDATEDLDDRLEALTETVGALRSELDRVVAAEHDRRAVDDLQTAANRHGERTASCDDCGATVDVGLLSRPRCPHCEATYVSFRPSTGLFGSATLATGDRPALEAGDAGDADREAASTGSRWPAGQGGSADE